MYIIEYFLFSCHISFKVCILCSDMVVGVHLLYLYDITVLVCVCHVGCHNSGCVGVSISYLIFEPSSVSHELDTIHSWCVNFVGQS